MALRCTPPTHQAVVPKRRRRVDGVRDSKTSSTVTEDQPLYIISHLSSLCFYLSAQKLHAKRKTTSPASSRCRASDSPAEGRARHHCCQFAIAHITVKGNLIWKTTNTLPEAFINKPPPIMGLILAPSESLDSDLSSSFLTDHRHFQCKSAPS